MRCGSCGWDNPAGITFCTNCGKRVAERPLSERSGAVHQGGIATAALPTLGEAHVHADGRSAASLPSCPRCLAEAEPGMRFCRECGAKLELPASPSVSVSTTVPPTQTTVPAPPPKGLHCGRCGSERDASAAFCRQCGASFKDPQNAGFTPPQSAMLRALSQAGSLSAGARLVSLLKDGSEGRSIPLTDRNQDIGGSEGDVTFPDDPYLSPRHARVLCREGTYSLRDLDSVNGVYVRLREDTELRDRDMILAGQQVLRFELVAEREASLGPAYHGGVMVFGTPEAPRFARLVQYTTEGVPRDIHYLFRDETVIGRENGDIVFTDDPFLSRRHAALRVDHAGKRFTLHDLGSSNGTALRIRREHVLKDGDQFRIGKHLFRFEAGGTGGRGAR